MEINAERQSGAKVTANYEFGETLDELIEKFTPEVVYSHAKRSFVIALQAYMRTQLDQGKQPEEILVAIETWKPGQRKAGKSAGERVSELLDKMSPAERAQLMKEYRAKEKEREKQAA